MVLVADRQTDVTSRRSAHEQSSTLVLPLPVASPGVSNETGMDVGRQTGATLTDGTRPPAIVAAGAERIDSIL